jgi:predicted peroxiredoxin
LIESRDPFESNDVASFYALAKDLAQAGNRVTLFLVQNGVLPARPCVQAEAVAAVARAGVEVLADDFALRERGIAADRLAVGVKAASLEIVVDRLAAGHKALWH